MLITALWFVEGHGSICVGPDGPILSSDHREGPSSSTRTREGLYMPFTSHLHCSAVSLSVQIPTHSSHEHPLFEAFVYNHHSSSLNRISDDLAKRHVQIFVYE